MYILDVNGSGSCPRCQSTDIKASRKRKIWDFLMRVVDLRPFRCRECRSRFYLPSAFDRRMHAERSWLRGSRRAEQVKSRSASA